MRRLLPFIPIIFLFLFNSCANSNTTYPPEMWTGLVQTNIALTWTASPTQTLNPAINNMQNWLNYDLSTVSPLGRAMDAEYHVIKVSFLNVPNSSALIFRMDVRCICMSSSDCCIPERTFVVLMESMKRNPSLIQVPTGVSEIIVVCSNHQDKEQFGAISANWSDAYGFLSGNITAEQLSANAVRTVAP